MSTAETAGQILGNLGNLEEGVNRLQGKPLNQAGVAAQMLQVHATLALAGAVVLVAEEIASLRAALTEE